MIILQAFALKDSLRIYPPIAITNQLFILFKVQVSVKAVDEDDAQNQIDEILDRNSLVGSPRSRFCVLWLIPTQKLNT